MLRIRTPELTSLGKDSDYDLGGRELVVDPDVWSDGVPKPSRSGHSLSFFRRPRVWFNPVLDQLFHKKRNLGVRTLPFIGPGRCTAWRPMGRKGL